MSTFQPRQRQALRKAADADLHPTLPANDAPIEDLATRSGASTSDTMRDPGPEKSVELTVEIPKSLRKRLRKAAERSATTPDAIVAMLLRAYLGE